MKKMTTVIYEFIQQETYANEEFKKGLTTKYISERLNIQRSNVSASLNSLVKKNMLSKSNTRPVLYSLKEMIEEDFESLIGSDGSLQNAIKLAKAAILYPNSGMNVLISAEQGCGTSFFVSKMYQFAVNSHVISSDKKLLKVNCRNFSKDISSLNTLLFGEKGDYTDSCFAKSWNGMLFIDHYDLLDVTQQSQVLWFLETGITIFKEEHPEYRDGNLLVVLSSSVHSKVHKNNTIPMVINLPEISEKSSEELFQLINHFFLVEAYNSDRQIIVPKEVTTALLLSEYSFNLKELGLEIKSACANAYVRVVRDHNQDVLVSLEDFNGFVKKGLLRRKENRMIIEKLMSNSEAAIFGKETGYKQKYISNTSLDIYKKIESEYDELENWGVKGSSINNIINGHIKNLFYKYSYDSDVDNKNNLEQLSKVVSPEIITLISEWLEDCRSELKREFEPNVFYGLCLHVNSLIASGGSRTDKDKKVNQVTKIVQDYPDEYVLCSQLCTVITKQFNIDISMEELVLIMLFIISSEEKNEVGNPVLLYVLHGEGSATALAVATNQFIKSNNIYGYNVLLDMPTQESMVEIKELLSKIDQGQGVIVIYDMGSIKLMLEKISEELGISIRLINIPITMIGIEVARRCMMETNIDGVYHTVLKDMNQLQASNEKSKLIITLCHTGEGGALQLKRYIDQYSKIGIEVKALAISNKAALVKEIRALKNMYKIHAFVGTYDPKLFGIPFIPISEVFEVRNDHIDNVLMFKPMNTNIYYYEEMYQNLEKELKYTSIPKLKTVLPKVIEEMTVYFSLTDNKQVGLFMHLACLVERLLSGDGEIKNAQCEQVIKVFNEESKELMKLVRPLEKSFDVIITEDEIATMIATIKEL